MQIVRAEFKCSSERLSQIPRDDMRDFAFIGRSNVGKSSLINMLTGNSSLAKVSSTPGKTRLINHFSINREWYLVDLPGYGYARASKSVREKFSKIITSYVTRARKMHFLFVLVDSRLEPQRIDLEFIEMLGENGIPFGVVFTKSDKLSKSQLASSVAKYKSTLMEQWDELPPIFITSSEKREGRDEILSFIESCLDEIRLGGKVSESEEDEMSEEAESEDEQIELIDKEEDEIKEPQPEAGGWIDDDMGMSEEEFAESIKKYIK